MVADEGHAWNIQFKILSSATNMRDEKEAQKTSVTHPRAVRSFARLISNLALRLYSVSRRRLSGIGRGDTEGRVAIGMLVQWVCGDGKDGMPRIFKPQSDTAKMAKSGSPGRQIFSIDRKIGAHHVK